MVFCIRVNERAGEKFSGFLFSLINLWKVLPKVIDETVRVAKKFLEEHPEEIHLGVHGRSDQGVGARIIANFLNAELAKYETWEAFKKYNFNLINLLDLKVKETEERNFQILKSKGVGQTTIENMEEWKPSPIVIDETVRVTKLFLEEHPEEVKKLAPMGTTLGQRGNS